MNCNRLARNVNSYRERLWEIRRSIFLTFSGKIQDGALPVKESPVTMSLPLQKDLGNHKKVFNFFEQFF